MHQKDRLECFVKLKEDSFALLYKFPDIKHYEFKPGQFSKSGKKLYTNIAPYISYDKRNSIDTSILVCFEREKTNSKFKKYKVIKTMSIKEIVTQVSSSYDEKISIGVTSKRWEWDSTNLKYIIECASISEVRTVLVTFITTKHSALLIYFFLHCFSSCHHILQY